MHPRSSRDLVASPADPIRLSSSEPLNAMDLPAPITAEAESLLAPPPTLRPVTSDPRYHDLRQEIDKLGSLTGPGVDWRAISTLGQGLTREIGKDLAVIAYTAFAGLKLRGLPGLLPGLVTLARLVREPPAGLTPNKPLGRARAVEWLLARLQTELQSTDPGRLDPPSAAVLPGALRELRSACRDVLGDLSPSFGPLLQLATALQPAEAPTPEAPETSPIQATTVASSPDAPPTGHADSPPAPAATDPHAPASPPRPDPATDLRALASPWLAPIDPATPCGTEPSGHDAFREAREELAKLTAPSGEPVDWPRLESRSAALLQTVAKDLRAAAWWTLARFHRGGLAGLAQGLAVVALLLEDFGAQLHPQRPKPRRDTAEWLIKQLAAGLAALPTERIQAAPLADVQTASETLGRTLRAHLGDDAPALRPLRDALQRLADAVPPPAPPEPPQAATEPPPAPVPSDIPAPRPTSAPLAVPQAAALTDLSALDGFLAATGESLQAAARTLREAAPADPRAYRLLRAGLWIGLAAPPPLRPDGCTGLPGLEDRDRALLDEHAAAGRFPALLQRSENLLVQHRLVLDLQRYTAAALTGLGPEFASAGLALRAELRALLTRLPELAGLRDREGRPLADPATQRWLADEVLPRPGTTTAVDPDEAAFWSDLRERLRRDDRSEALTEAQRRIDASPSEQRRYERRLALAEACDAAGQHPLAAALFGGLADDLERRDLDRWDPSLTTRCLTGLARCQHRRGEPAQLLVHRIGNLDATAASVLLAELSV